MWEVVYILMMTAATWANSPSDEIYYVYKEIMISEPVMIAKSAEDKIVRAVGGW
jgi:hypothetical protein